MSCDNSTGDTILHAAAFLGEAKLVSALAHYRPVGLEIDVRNNKGICNCKISFLFKIILLDSASNSKIFHLKN